MKFIEDLTPEEREVLRNKRRQISKEEQAGIVLEDKARYRCEQTTVMKVNGVIVTHGDTKREFIVQRIIEGGKLFFKIEMVDNIITIVPKELLEAAKLLNEFENVKSDLLLKVDDNTGMISDIVNYKDVVERWNSYKNELYARYSFLRTDANQDKRDNYLDTCEKVIGDKKILINDLRTKMFYDLFFGKYLVSQTGLFEPYKRIFNSQLFQGVEVELDFRQEVLRESPEMYHVKKTGKLNKNYDIQKVKEIYKKQYQPQLHYQFSEFDFMMIENTVVDIKDSYWIEQSDVSMAERIKNNMDVIVDYKLRKIEV